MAQNILQRGTTPIHSFTLPSELADKELAAIYVTYQQGRKIILEKNMDELTILDGVVSYSMSQSETLLFREGQDCLIQLRIRTENGDALASNILNIPVYGVLKDGVV